MNVAPPVLAVVDAALFAGAGWIGVLFSELLYGAIEPEPEGPEPIAVRLPVFLAATVCIGAAIGFSGATIAHTALLLVAVAALCACAATDLRAGMIPDRFTLIPLAIILVWAAFDRSWTPLIGAVFGLVPFAVLALISRGRGMGWGDVKLATLGGSLAGMSGLTIAVALAAIGLATVALARGRLRSPVAFGPYLSLAIGASLTLGPWV